MKLGRMTDYATLVMTQLAVAPHQMRSAHDLATQSRIGAPTVAKLLRLLSRAGLVNAERGVCGGYKLARRADTISVADIVAAIEGPVALTECAGSHSRCSIEQSCGVRGSWRLINTAIQQALEAVTLQKMAENVRQTHALPDTFPLERQDLSPRRSPGTATPEHLAPHPTIRPAEH